MGLLFLCSMVAKNSARGSIHDTVRLMTSSTSPWSWHRFLLDWSSHASLCCFGEFFRELGCRVRRATLEGNSYQYLHITSVWGLGNPVWWTA